MRCEECMRLVLDADTERLEDLSGVAEHVGGCDQCRLAAQLIVDAEHEVRRQLKETRSRRSDAEVIRAVVASVERRRRARIVYVTLLIVMLPIAAFAASRVVGSLVRAKQEALPDLETVTLTVNCVTPAEAGELIQPYLRSHGSIYRVGTGSLSVITVRATDKEIAQVRELLSRFDSASRDRCAATARRP